ncbi:hypothetical protein F5Y10DRAFT_270798 [Nemania abortiva]|nr:hypothetical protein F5Y10DRAFT_270798 [Nemania abortiva]
MDGYKEQTVASRTRLAEDRFNEIINQLELSGKVSSISIESVTDALDRFKLWVGDVEARQPAASPTSLEARLATAGRTLQQVEDLQGGLIKALNDLLEITCGQREDRRISDENLIDHDDLTPLENQLEAKPSLGTERTESQDILDVITDFIRTLLKIGALIRRITPPDRFSRALQSGDPLMDQFDINYVAERYPKLNRPDSEWLCARLGRAITKRRRFLRHVRENSNRTVAPRVDDRGNGVPYVLSKDSSDGNAFDISSPGMPSSASVGTKLGGSVVAHTHVSTKASTLDIAMLQQLQGDEANKEETETFISSSSFPQDESEDSGLHLPRLEDLSKGESIFECPFCLGIQEFTRESVWRKHAYRDLKAYVCTLGKDKCDLEMFGDSRAWFDHELRCHRKQWVCILCSKGPFRTPTDFKLHTKNNHAHLLLDGGELEHFMDAGQRPVDTIAADECPFCDDWEVTLKDDTTVSPSTDPSGIVMTVEPVQFRRHVASHMEQLALFAIPRNTGDDES